MFCATLKTWLYCVNIYWKVSENIWIKCHGIGISLLMYFKMIFGPCHDPCVSRKPYIVVVYLQFQPWPCEFCDGKFWTYFSLTISVILFQYQAEKFFILFHLLLTVNNLSVDGVASDIRKISWNGWTIWP